MDPIYVSTNGGVFSPWLLGTNGTSGVFVGEVGQTYGFYSIARDLVGSMEPAPLVPDAWTKVISGVINPPPTLKLRPDARVGDQWALIWPAAAQTWGLQWKPSLDDTNWNPATEIPEVFGSDVVAPLRMTNSQRFFRLKQP